MGKFIEYSLLTAGGLIGAGFVVMMAWLPAILCVAVGHGPDVCGL